MRLVFMGTPDFAVPALDALLAAGHEVAAVYTQPPRPAGRGKAERATPVHVRADARGLTVRHPSSLRSSQEKEAMAALGADLAVVVAYGLLLPQAILDAPAHGCLNIHASLLPRWRGAAPIHRAILAGDSQTGVCIMRMEAGLDTGPVLLREVTQIGADETTADLHDRLSDLGARLIVDAVSRLDTLVPEVQPEDGVTYAEKIEKVEARIDWTQSADVVARQIRGLSPFPGAWADAEGTRLKLLRARAVAGTGAPGDLIAPARVACGSGAVEIGELQWPGKRPMLAGEALRGRRLPERLG